MSQYPPNQQQWQPQQNTGYPQYPPNQQQWQQPMQPPQKPRKPFNRKVGIGCGVLAVLLVLIIGIAVASQGGSSTNTNTNSNTNSHTNTQATTAPTSKPLIAPTSAQVNSMMNIIDPTQSLVVASYDQKSAALILQESFGYKVTVSQDIAKSTLQDDQANVWQQNLYFSSVTINLYQYQQNGPEQKIAYSVLKYRTALTIHAGTDSDLWSSYDQKWIDPSLASF